MCREGKDCETPALSAQPLVVVTTIRERARERVLCSVKPRDRLWTEDVDITVQEDTWQKWTLATSERQSRKALSLARPFVDRDLADPTLEQPSSVPLTCPARHCQHGRCADILNPYTATCNG
jgi:hypothetical protein